MKRRFLATLAVGTLTMVPATHAAAQPDHEPFFVETLVATVEPGAELHETPNGKWSFFEDKFVTTEGIASIGSTEYDTASLEATIWGKLGPGGTQGIEWGTFTLSLDPGDLSCEGTFMVKRYATTVGPYGEAGNFRADCDDGTKVKGDMVGEVGTLSDGSGPGFVVTLDGTSR